MNLGQAEQHCTVYTKCTHIHLFVLNCTTTWHQPGLSRGFVDPWKNLGRTEGQIHTQIHTQIHRYTVVFIELLPQLKKDHSKEFKNTIQRNTCGLAQQIMQVQSFLPKYFSWHRIIIHIQCIFMMPLLYEQCGDPTIFYLHFTCFSFFLLKV